MKIVKFKLKNISTLKKSIWVIKKNKTVLENLILWLDKQRKNDNTEKINGVPFLIIDDEADNASIQSLTKKEFELWETGIEISNLDFDDLNEEQERKLNEVNYFWIWWTCERGCSSNE